MSETERAWAAGFFDGEGSTCVQGNGLKIDIQQMDRYSLDRFHAATGYWGTLNGPYVYADERSPRFSYAVVGLARIQRVLGEIWPYLGPIKKQQAIDAIERWVSRETRVLPFRSSLLAYPVQRPTPKRDYYARSSRCPTQ